jgi:hypothetical protein
LTVRFQARGYEGEEDVPAEHEAAQKNPRIPRPDEHEKWALGAEAAARERAQTADRKYQIDIGFVPVP